MFISEQCEGDLRWTDCWFPCELTCWDQAPICIERCDPKCECPHEAPIRMYPDDPITGPRCRPRSSCGMLVYHVVTDVV